MTASLDILNMVLEFGVKLNQRNVKSKCCEVKCLEEVHGDSSNVVTVTVNSQLVRVYVCIRYSNTMMKWHQRPF